MITIEETSKYLRNHWNVVNLGKANLKIELDLKKRKQEVFLYFWNANDDESDPWLSIFSQFVEVKDSNPKIILSKLVQIGSAIGVRCNAGIYSLSKELRLRNYNLEDLEFEIYNLGSTADELDQFFNASDKF